MLSSFMLMITPMFLDKKSSSLILYHWLKAGADLRWCQMTTDCTTTTTRRTNTAVTAAPATAEVDVHWVGTPDEVCGVS